MLEAWQCLTHASWQHTALCNAAMGTLCLQHSTMSGCLMLWFWHTLCCTTQTNCNFVGPFAVQIAFCLLKKSVMNTYDIKLVHTVLLQLEQVALQCMQRECCGCLLNLLLNCCGSQKSWHDQGLLWSQVCVVTVWQLMVQGFCTICLRSNCLLAMLNL